MICSTWHQTWSLPRSFPGTSALLHNTSGPYLAYTGSGGGRLQCGGWISHSSWGYTSNNNVWNSKLGMVRRFFNIKIYAFVNNSRNTKLVCRCEVWPLMSLSSSVTRGTIFTLSNHTTWVHGAKPQNVWLQFILQLALLQSCRASVAQLNPQIKPLLAK